MSLHWGGSCPWTTTTPCSPDQTVFQLLKLGPQIESWWEGAEVCASPDPTASAVGSTVDLAWFVGKYFGSLLQVPQGGPQPFSPPILALYGQQAQ